MTKSGESNQGKQSDADRIAPPEGDLSVLRNQIDAIDDQLVELLNKRAHCAQEVGKVKAKTSQRAYVPSREHQLITRLMNQNSGPLPSNSIRLIYKEIISACLALESPLQVSFLGPEATFTHEATKRHFGLSAQLCPQRTIPEVFGDVESGRCEYGVVPIENSTEGVVNHTLDSFMTSELRIGAEVLLDVSHHLLTQSGNIQGITKIYSHPQALAQCRGWLERNLPGTPLIDVSSTGRAAQLAAEDNAAAAVASDLAASLYELQIAHSHLQDVHGNMTRFLVIGKDEAQPTGHDKTSLMFALKDAPGILYEALSCFADFGINMSRIESRPSRRRAWDYLFFIDIEGHQSAENVGKAIESLKNICQYLRVLGSYPSGIGREP